jgi:hypothetical protein
MFEPLASVLGPRAYDGKLVPPEIVPKCFDIFDIAELISTEG